MCSQNLTLLPDKCFQSLKNKNIGCFHICPGSSNSILGHFFKLFKSFWKVFKTLFYLFLVLKRPRDLSWMLPESTGGPVLKLQRVPYGEGLRPNSEETQGVMCKSLCLLRTRRQAPACRRRCRRSRRGDDRRR